MLRRLVRRLVLVPLAVLLAVLASWQLPAGGRHETTFRWHMDAPQFGGFSALNIAPDGRAFTAVTDRGHWLTGTIRRDGRRITGVDASPLRPLRNERGDPVAPEESDSEGLVIAPDGTAFVSFEQRLGIRRYATLDSPAERLPDGPFRSLPFNAGLESVALDGDTLLTIPEAPNNGTYTLWRLEGRAWTRGFVFPQRGVFRVADAKVFEGHLFVLERAFLGIAFSSRVRRFAMDGSGETTLLTSRPGKFDNLEGLAIWRDGDDTVITMLSDDNFLPFERTEFVEYRFPD